ncbi:ribosome hibernation promotion factor [Nocardia inohanensis]|uniref:ribosome hibernation promotion factor n=1 Tax=Nocardia inohanensis TaxID=209246 RepID=UPI000835FF81|nr:HPF/RaiA family ribosome-associated protein [Nocardia inohanensis]
MPARHVTESESVLQISTGHHVSAGGPEYAREKVGRALAFAPAPVLSARVRLSGHRDPAVRNPIVAQANVHMAGRTVRVQVAAPTTRAAVDLLEARLETRFERLARHWEAVRGRFPAAGPHEWRRGTPPRSALPYFPRVTEQREVVRHKAYALAEETCEEAAFDMELLDYDFHLFTESGSGIDSVLYRESGGYRLAQLESRPEAVLRGSVPFTISPAAAPVTTVAGAIERLELTGWPFVFFRDGDRGRVLYHRYDGHYGLLTPAA